MTLKALNEDHGMSGLPIYGVWIQMHNRCSNPASSSYRHYGGRGITVCERWNSIHAFLVDMGHPPAGRSIGRIDNDGNYEPSNCRWETQEQQNENTRRNRYITWQDRSQTIKAWAQELDLDPRCLHNRINRNWTVERALTTPTFRSYEQGREQHLEYTRLSWAANGRRYRGLDKDSEPIPVSIKGRRPAPRPLRTTPTKRRPPSPDRLARITRAQELHQQGYTCRQIADQLGISKSSVSIYLNTPNSSAA